MGISTFKGLGPLGSWHCRPHPRFFSFFHFSHISNPCSHSERENVTETDTESEGEKEEDNTHTERDRESERE